MGDPGPLVEQPQQFCIQSVNRFSMNMKGCRSAFLTVIVRGLFRLRRFFRTAGGGTHCLPLLAHDLFPRNQKAATPWGSAACGFYDVYLYAMKSLHTIRYAATPEKVAVNKSVAKSVGVHAGWIVV